MPSTYDLIRIGAAISAAALDPDGPEAADLAALDVPLPEARDQWAAAAAAKAAAIAVVHRKLGADAAHARTEAKRLTGAAERLEREQERVAALGFTLCEAAAEIVGEPKIGGLRLQPNPPALAGALDEPDRWPAAYVVAVPATTKLDRAALKKALLGGEPIEGFSLAVGVSLRGLK